MTIKALDDQTGAQTGAAFNIGPVGGGILRAEAERMRLEAYLTGTFTDIVTSIETSVDGTTFESQISSTAGDGFVALGSSNAPYVRVVTTGTSGPYDVDLVVSRA